MGQPGVGSGVVHLRVKDYVVTTEPANTFIPALWRDEFAQRGYSGAQVSVETIGQAVRINVIFPDGRWGSVHLPGSVDLIQSTYAGRSICISWLLSVLHLHRSESNQSPPSIGPEEVYLGSIVINPFCVFPDAA